MLAAYKKEKAEELAGERLPWRQSLDKVDALELWDGKNREERAPWSGYLLDADKLMKKPRKSIPKVYMYFYFLSYSFILKTVPNFKMLLYHRNPRSRG